MQTYKLPKAYHHEHESPQTLSTPDPIQGKYMHYSTATIINSQKVNIYNNKIDLNRRCMITKSPTFSHVTQNNHPFRNIDFANCEIALWLVPTQQENLKICKMMSFRKK